MRWNESERRSSSGRRYMWSKSGPPWRTMIGVPCPTSRAYNSAFPAGMRLSRGTAARLLSDAAVELGGNHTTYAKARAARTSVPFIALKLHQPTTSRNLVPTATCLLEVGRQSGSPVEHHEISSDQS